MHTLSFSFSFHPLVAEHVAIYFRQMAQARTAPTKMFYLHAQQLEGEEK